MIASTIGHTFLKVYNEKTGNNYTAKEFFEKEYVHLFYDYPLYMMTGGNSPLENPKISWKKGVRPSLEERKKRITKTIKKIESNAFDASIAIGYPASEIKEYATTSGLISNLNLKHSVEDKYLSWIGSGFGCCVKGGLSIYFTDIKILWKIYEGWIVYRNILNDKTLSKLRGNQIEAWNSQWLTFSWNKRLFRKDFDFAHFHNISMFKVDEKTIEVIPVVWSKLIFSISTKFQDQSMISYIYSLGQTNTTLGFYPIHFGKAQSLIDYYNLLFGQNATITDAKDYEILFGQKIHNACKYGEIGLHALQPIALFEDINKNKKINTIKFRTYKTWLTAMINKEETLELTSEIANKLHLFEKGSKGTDRRALLEKLLKSGKKDFLNYWDEIVIQIPVEERKKLKEFSDKIFFMSKEDFGYFSALLKLDYRYQEK
ncbi:MAG: hypothetical protein JKX79_11905 [Labilibaculum sp.]|nr:hypothetical protein [Labilibaculum sp.]